MRDICKKMECNQGVIQALTDGRLLAEWKGFVSFKEAEAKLETVSFESLIERLHLIGTAYYLPEDCKNYHYHSIASNLVKIFQSAFGLMNLSDFLDAEILDVQEKKLGYDRAKTIKIILNNKIRDVLCFITAETEVCDVPKKQENSTGKGLRITSISTSKPSRTFAELLCEAGIKHAIILNWISETFFRKMDTHMETLRGLSEAAITEAAITGRKLKKEAKELAELANQLAEEISKNLGGW